MIKNEISPAPLPGRRALLTGAGLAATAAAVLPLFPTPAQAYHTPASERAPRYKDTPHNRRFYELNRQ